MFSVGVVSSILALGGGFTSTETGGAQSASRSDSDGAASSWALVWRDDFDGDELDRSKWAPEESCWGGGNKERQCYVDRVKNIEVADGVLRLKAFRGRHTGPLYPSSMRRNSDGRRMQYYTSGKITTHDLSAWRYGRFSARLKLPAGQGTWPAFWMMPAESIYGKWPLSGEIDIMEAVNLGTPCEDCPGGIESRTSGALHFGDLEPNNTYLFSKSAGMAQGTPADDWRVYSVEWAAGVVQWFVDGEIFMRITSDEWRTAAENAEGRPYAPFDQPFYLILNNAVGGNLPEKSNGRGFDRSSFPSELQVDWVTVEVCEGDRETGRACLSDAEWTGRPQGPWETQAR